MLLLDGAAGVGDLVGEGGCFRGEWVSCGVGTAFLAAGGIGLTAAGRHTATTLLARITGKTAAEIATETASSASASVSKFRDYLFKEGTDHGKDAVFRAYGYSACDSQALATELERRAAAKYASGNSTLGKADQYGQRININITLRGQGAATGRSTRIVTGWMIRGDGSITLNTPFSGFRRCPASCINTIACDLLPIAFEGKGRLLVP